MIESLVWLVPLTVAGLGAWRPHAGLVALAASLPLFGSPPGGPYLGALEAAGAAAIACTWRTERPRPTPLAWPAAAFVVVSLASMAPLAYLPPSWQPGMLLELARAVQGVESWPGLYTWRAALDLLLGWGLFIAVRRAFAGRSPRPLALALLAGLTAVLAIGLATQTGLLDLDAFRPRHGIYRPLPRLNSLFFLSGWLSQYIVLATPISIAALATGGPQLRRLAAPLAATALVGLALTQQRGAWVAVGAQIVAFALVTAADRQRLPHAARGALAAAATAVVLVAALLWAGLSLGPVLERATSIRSGVEPRAELWSAAIDLTRQRPLLGWGLGSFAPAYDLEHPRGAPGSRPYRETAHNLYFHVAAERGLLGLSSLALVAAAAAGSLWRPREGQKGLALALGLCLLGGAVYGLVQYTFYLRNLAWLQWLLLGCVALVGRERRLLFADRTAGALIVAALVLVPVRAGLVERPRFAGDRSFGFHELEQHAEGPLQWTSGFAARRLACSGSTLVLELANGHPRAAEHPVAVTVAVDGTELAALKIPGGWEEHRFALGPPQKDWILLTLRAEPTFRPFRDFRGIPKLRRSIDIRSLGIAVRKPRCEP